MVIFYQEDFHSASTELNAEESKHAAKVLRVKAGDMIHVTDGKGKLFTCEVIAPHPKHTTLVVKQQSDQAQSSKHRHVAIGPTKNMDRLEWFVEKSVELGINEISFILTQNGERRVLKTDRLIKKAISAMKQSGNLHLPKINELTKFQDFLHSCSADQRFLAYVDHENPILLKNELNDTEHQLVLIGPEGDFTADEVEKAIAQGFVKVSLGPSRLRTETAGVVAVHLMNL